MDWKRYQPRRSGQCHIDIGGEDVLADFELGIIETGRTRVFSGEYIKVIVPEGDEWLAEGWSPLAALRALDEEIALVGARLLCAGLHEGFYESGLSAGTGYGYIHGYRGAVHMLERPSLIAKDEQASQPSSDAAEILAAVRERAHEGR
jgi:hypothetical protein